MDDFSQEEDVQPTMYETDFHDDNSTVNEDPLSLNLAMENEDHGDRPSKSNPMKGLSNGLLLQMFASVALLNLAENSKITFILQ
jgi:hypothetical protein